MIKPFKSLLLSAAVVTAAMPVSAAPVGLCLTSYSPLAPPDAVECFEYLKYERAQDGLRFFLVPNGTTIVPTIRFRRVMVYFEGASPTDPKFKAALDDYTKTAAESPATRKYLLPRIEKMRALAEAYGKVQARENKQESISLRLKSGIVLEGCKVTRIEDGVVVILHKDGIAKVDMADLSDSDKITLKLQQFQKRAEENRKIEIAQAEDAQKAAQQRADDEETLDALAIAAGTRCGFVVRRKLKFEDFPGVGWKMFSEDNGYGLYEVSTQGEELCLLVTSNTEFLSAGRATMWLVHNGTQKVVTTLGFAREVSVYVEADPADVEAYQKFLVEFKKKYPMPAGRGR